MGLIYKITNQKTNEAYIGKTSRKLSTRLYEHKKDCETYSGNNIALYNAVKKYGWNNFKVEIIEDNIEDNDLNFKEKYYINFFNTYNNGYNCTIGGDGGRCFSKLTENQVQEIISILKDENNLQSFSEIAKIYLIDTSVINRINSGETWFQENENYPLRKYQTTGLTLPKSIYKNIINDLLYSNLPLKEIANKYNISNGQMTAINQGYECYNNNNFYYKGIYEQDYPIRKTKNKKHDLENQIENILYDILFTKESITKIANKYKINGSSLYYIQSGQRQKHLTELFITPLRKNIKINQEIYNNLYRKEQKCDTQV